MHSSHDKISKYQLKVKADDKSTAMFKLQIREKTRPSGTRGELPQYLVGRYVRYLWTYYLGTYIVVWSKVGTIVTG